MRRLVSVVGPADATVQQEAAARAVGAGLAALGVVVVTGGLGGVMAAASRGAAEAGGLVVGLLPGADRHEANDWVDVSVPTALAEARDALVAAAGEVVVVVGGSWGTLAEVALAARRHTPVVLLGDPLVDPWWVMSAAGPVGGVLVAPTAAEAVETVSRLLGAPATDPRHEL